jgi:aldose 1-epimerase
MKNSVSFQNHDVLQLSAGPSIVHIAPQFGARLLDWRCNGKEIIHWPETADWSLINKVRGGNPVLFPFIARHMVDGEIGKWIHPDGRVLDLPMHGFARDFPFTVLETPNNEAAMELRENETTLGAYPYPFRFEVRYRLESNSLTCLFTVENTGKERMPWHAGHHFYFAVPAADRARWMACIPAREWGRQNPDGSVAYQPSGSSNFTLADKAASDRFQVLPPEATASLEGPDWTLHFDLQVPGSLPWHTVTTWTQSADSNFYCIEPWLGLPNAIHHGDGLRWLEPGRTEQAIGILRLWS